MKERGESFLQLLLKMMGQSMAMQTQNPTAPNDVEVLVAFLRRDRATLKRILAEQLEGMEGSLTALARRMARQRSSPSAIRKLLKCCAGN